MTNVKLALNIKKPGSSNKKIGWDATVKLDEIRNQGKTLEEEIDRLFAEFKKEAEKELGTLWKDKAQKKVTDF